MKDRILAIICLAAITAGAALHLTGNGGAGDAVWATAIVIVLVPLTWDVVKTLLNGRLGVDAIALLAMATALAMAEYLAGIIVGLMLSGGGALEDWAANRSRREMRKLVERAPRVAQRKTAGQIHEIPVDEIAVGDTLIVRGGEVLPADGAVLSTAATIDESALTGESLPVTLGPGEPVRSGTLNVGDAFEFRTTREAKNSAYSALVRLVAEAEENRAPFVRMADRYAAFLLPLTLLLGGAAWALSGDSVRFLAVLVVATPCPLILAAPIAFVAGISRAAESGIIVKGGNAIEALGKTKSVLLDKTGTLTFGSPAIDRAVPANHVSPEELLRYAASVDQLSAHVLAASLVRDVESRGIALTLPEGVREVPGQGISGRVGKHAVIAGSAAMLRADAITGIEDFEIELDSKYGVADARVFVALDGSLAGALLLADHVRADAGRLVEDLYAHGVNKVAMVTGDNAQVAAQIADAVGITDVRSGLTPEQKLQAIAELRADPETSPVLMVGDGVNDAPALAMADVGIAMTSGGLTAAAEAADAVIVVDRIDRVVDAISIGKRSLLIATQSVTIGLGLSLVAMAFAALGMIPPVAGALLQEIIDVAVILNALRALTD